MRSAVGEQRVAAAVLFIVGQVTTILALTPVITSQGRGSDVMMPMALPSVGGMTIALITLFVVPVLTSALEERRAKRRAGA